MKGTWKNVRVTIDEALLGKPDLGQLIEKAKKSAFEIAKNSGWNFQAKMLTAQIACNPTKISPGNPDNVWFQLTWTSSGVVNNAKRMNIFKSIKGNRQSAISFKRVIEALETKNIRELLWK